MNLLEIKRKRSEIYRNAQSRPQDDPSHVFRKRDQVAFYFNKVCRKVTENSLFFYFCKIKQEIHEKKIQVEQMYYIYFIFLLFERRMRQRQDETTLQSKARMVNEIFKSIVIYFSI